MTNPSFRSGYASLIGKPNVGKSTLLNRLVSRKLAAMTRRPQTTRNKITGICHLKGGQIILLDTPGIHEAKSQLNKLMVQAATNTYRDVDLILFMIGARDGFKEEDAFVLDSMENVETPKVLVINKIDLVPKPRLLGLIDSMNAKEKFEEIIPISAMKEDGLDVLKEVILKRLPEGPQYFPEDMVTDCPEEFLTGEIIREKIIKLTHLEVPYVVAVDVESMEAPRPGVTVIHAAILVEKGSQKKIIVGEKGSLIKKIGMQSRQELERRLGGKVHLELFVKVKTNWREDPRSLRDLGYMHDSH